ncbi:hypothetical protein AMTR_s00062p00075920 [Amborella trichopoda]|uniref:Uncharacterized protein n=2 Tax=Amborella trichopoda TaxID=13333 RepID=U5DAM6_AMBTC|nr:hypothetical protein AMTR_s00062p00075920 [Amborella trichopoda]
MPSMVKAFLDSGAKAIIASSIEPPESQACSRIGPNDNYTGLENGRFVIGEEDAEDEEPTVPVSPVSDWEDSDLERSEGPMSGRDEEEEELSRFICAFYDALFREGTKVDEALHHALRTHPRQRYKCHLPSIR